MILESRFFPSQAEAGLTPKKENVLDVLRISYLRKRTLILASVWCGPLTAGTGGTFCFLRT